MPILPRVVLFTVALHLVASPAHADLRDSVVVAEAEPNVSFSNAFEEVADKFDEEGNDEAAEFFRSLNTGWHGSGFAVEGSNGRTYLITNRHVVEYAETISFTLLGIDGNSRSIGKGLSAIVDDQVDLAVIPLPQQLEEKIATMRLIAEEYPDGTEVFAAGYPGLFGEPSWQLSRGSITNRRAFVEDLIDPTVSHLIQHSASIDAGNSGGPLLVALGQPGSYGVVGVNTWTVGGRTNTFFAIPADRVRRLIDRATRLEAIRRSPDEIEREVETVFEEYFDLLVSESWDPEEEHLFVSTELSAERGWDSYLRLRRDGPKELVEAMSNRFGSLSPFDVLRESTAWAMWHTFRTQLSADSEVRPGGVLNLPTSLVDGVSARAAVEVDNRTLLVELVFEQGNWRIRDMESLFPIVPVAADYSAGAEDVEEEAPKRFNDMALNVGLALVPAAINRSCEGSNAVSGALGRGEIRIPLAWYASLSVGLGVGYLDLTVEDPFDMSEVDTRFFSSNVVALLLLRYPISFSNADELTPFMGAGTALELYFPVSLEDDTVFGPGIAFAPRFGGGIEYQRVAGSWGFGVGFWGRVSLGVLTLEEGYPEINDFLVETYLLWVP